MSLSAVLDLSTYAWDCVVEQFRRSIELRLGVLDA